MLGKLMKYDLRSGIRTFSLIWIGLALLGAINGLTIRFVLAGDTQSGLVSFVFSWLSMWRWVFLSSFLSSTGFIRGFSETRGISCSRCP